MKTAVVLGMRSGTSLIANILNVWGVKMGEQFQGGDEYNRKGYFEDLALYHQIKNIVGDRFERIEQLQYISIADLKELKALLESKFDELWGFKIPDAVFILELLDILIPDPHYIVCMRHIGDMVKSLERVKHHRYPHGFDSVDYCIKYQDLMSDGVRGKNHIVFNYEDVLRYPVEELTQLKDFLGLEMNDTLFNQGVDLIKPELRHYAYNI